MKAHTIDRFDNPAPAPRRAATAGNDVVRDAGLLIEAVRAAGAIAMAGFRHDPRSWDKGGDNPVTEVDLAVDAHLKQALRAARPDYGWLSEETADDPSRLGRRRVWIVDPIDGTRAFIKGRPEFSIAAALVEDGRPVLAAVYNPATEELFEAHSGGGTRLNGHAATVTEACVIRDSRLLLSRREAEQEGWHRELDQDRVKALGSIAYKLALVASGHYDGTVTVRPKNDWDIAAAELLVTEAGGHVTTAAGAQIVYNRPKPLHPTVIAANPGLHGALLAMLARAGHGLQDDGEG